MTAVREMRPQPHAVIVAGPNGAGKSTMAPRAVSAILNEDAWREIQRQAGAQSGDEDESHG